MRTLSLRWHGFPAQEQGRHSVGYEGFNQRVFVLFAFAIWKPVGVGMELEWFLRIRLLSRAFSCIVQFCRQSFEREDFPLKLLSELEVARSRSGILSLGEGGPLPGHWLSQEDNAPWGRAAWAPWVLSSLCYSPPGAPLPQLCQPQMSPHIAIVPGEGGGTVTSSESHWDRQLHLGKDGHSVVLCSFSRQNGEQGPAAGVQAVVWRPSAAS